MTATGGSDIQYLHMVNGCVVLMLSVCFHMIIEHSASPLKMELSTITILVIHLL